MDIEVTSPDDPMFHQIARPTYRLPRLDYAQIAKQYNEAEVFSILTLQKGPHVTHLGNVRRYLEAWGLVRHEDFIAQVITCDEDQVGSQVIKRLIIEKRRPTRMVRPSK